MERMENAGRVQDSPVMTSLVESFSLEKLLHHQEEKGEFN